MRISPKTMQALRSATARGALSDASHAAIVHWLTRPEFAEFVPELVRQMDQENWAELDLAFWTTLPFGTAGRRGRMFPVGTNAINRRTVGETIVAAAEYVEQLDGSESPTSQNDRTQNCTPIAAVGFDVRHRSREFAELTCGILAARGWSVRFLESPRSTPQLALTVLEHGARLGFMVSASHNPPQDNAVKVFWRHGGQLRPPHETRIAAALSRVTEIRSTPFAQALSDGTVIPSAQAMDNVYQARVLACGRAPSDPDQRAHRRQFPILFSPLHGVGMTSVDSVLRHAGFEQTKAYAPHAMPDPEFSQVSGRIANPELPEVFLPLIKAAKSSGARLILATDPDADRVGCAAPLTVGGGEWVVLNGHRIAVLLAEFLLQQRQEEGRGDPNDYLIRTVVTTPMLDAIATRYGAECVHDVLTGFKWIAARIDERGAEHFVMAAEEAHGYLVAPFIRDKDAASASLVLAEYAARTDREGRTLCEELDRLEIREGAFVEQAFALPLPGEQGSRRMAALMARFRQQPPQRLGDINMSVWRDQQEGIERSWADPVGRAIPSPGGDVVWLILERPGFSVAVRPSGTEPKIKFYLFGRAHVPNPEALREVRADIQRNLSQIEADLRAFCEENLGRDAL